MADARAVARYARYAPRRVGQVMTLIRSKNAQQALTTLAFLPKGSAVPVEKALRSALANLSGKLGRKIEPREAWVKSCIVGQGPVLKRIHPGSMGRAMPFKRKTAHLTVVVTDELVGSRVSTGSRS